MCAFRHHALKVISRDCRAREDCDRRAAGGVCGNREGPALALWVMIGLEGIRAGCLSASLRSLPARVTASSPHPIPGWFGSHKQPPWTINVWGPGEGKNEGIVEKVLICFEAAKISVLGQTSVLLRPTDRSCLNWGAPESLCFPMFSNGSDVYL